MAAVEMARARWLASECARLGADATLGRLRREAEARFQQAHRAYGAARDTACKGAS
jgi:hypothetical protein